MQKDVPPDDLRRRAEVALDGDPVETVGLPPADLAFIIQELQVHQVELKLQNEALRNLQLELEISRDNFSNLYDFAPVCYCTLDAKGIIREANRLCSEMFGVEKSELIGQRLARFVYPDDQDLFYIHHRQTLKTREKQGAEIRIAGADGTVRHVQLQSAASGDPGKQTRVILSDITAHKRIEQTMRESEAKLAQRVRELNALHEATSSLLSTLDTPILLSRILESALKAIPAAMIGIIYLVTANPEPLKISAFAHSPDSTQETLIFSERTRYVWKALATRQRLLLDGIQQPPRKAGSADSQARSTSSALILPLITDEKPYGAISLESPEQSAFSEADMDLLESFAATATASIRNARLHEELQKTAITDYLTRVYNRQGFFEIGEHEFQRFLRSNLPLALIEMDIDGFKAINDTFGHPAGDQVLILMGQRLTAQLRKADVMGRYGGDEFMVLLPETDLPTALQVAKRLNRAIDEVPIQIGDQSIHITISQGIAQATKELKDLKSLVKLADDALYQAKAGGRNRIETL